MPRIGRKRWRNERWNGWGILEDETKRPEQKVPEQNKPEQRDWNGSEGKLGKERRKSILFSGSSGTQAEELWESSRPRKTGRTPNQKSGQSAPYCDFQHHLESQTFLVPEARELPVLTT
jgi:hypothetical protein